MFLQQGFQILPPRTADEFSESEKQFLELLDFTGTTRMLYRNLLRRPNLTKKTRNEIVDALDQIDVAVIRLSRLSELKDLQNAYKLIHGFFNGYCALSARTRKGK